MHLSNRMHPYQYNPLILDQLFILAEEEISALNYIQTRFYYT